jgi:hypothetical protein
VGHDSNSTNEGALASLTGRYRDSCGLRPAGRWHRGGEQQRHVGDADCHQHTASAAATGDPATAGGWLSLETGATSRVTYDANRDQIPEAVQTLSGNSTTCLLSTDSSLLKFAGYVGTGTTDLASLKSGSIGVADKKVGTSCYQVNAPLERLDIALAKVGQTASSALFDLEIKGSARILVTASWKGAIQGYFELQSGTTVGTGVPFPGT